MMGNRLLTVSSPAPWKMSPVSKVFGTNTGASGNRVNFPVVASTAPSRRYPPWSGHEVFQSLRWYAMKKSPCSTATRHTIHRARRPSIAEILVQDLAVQRFPLTGGRLDYVAGRPVAALVYQRDKHIIDLFVWPASASGGASTPETAQRQGYNLVHWTQNGMNFWAASDVEASQLKEFAETWQKAP